MGRQKKGLPINGIVLLDKPEGLSSNQALQICKRLFKAQKAGHTGSLDPLATGVLPLCFGEATKVSQYLLDADKGYRVTARLGAMTTTGDAEGDIVQELPIPKITQEQFKQVVQSFIGEIEQVPPMYSALKHEGQPLYKLAREGIEIERKARRVEIQNIEILELTENSFSLNVLCSKGTYIRTLVEDIGKALDCGAYVLSLRRTFAAPFRLEQCVSLKQLRDARDENESDDALLALLTPVHEALQQWPKLILSKADSDQLHHGQQVPYTAQQLGKVALFAENEQQFFGIGELMADGLLYARRLIRFE